MRRTNPNIDNWRAAMIRGFAALALLWVGCFSAGVLAQQPGQKTFSSAEEACNALIAAMQTKNEKALLELLGEDGKEIISSGDETRDLHTRADFVQRYLQMHRLVDEPDGTTTLYIGARNWPTPVPLVHSAAGWYFDAVAGKKEILYRRIGRDEMSAIRICQELALAEHEYHDAQHSQYAQAIFSDEGQHNGLYWKVAAGEPRSPIGPRVANADARADAPGRSEARRPYRGYYFHILTTQGKHARGGAKHYVVDGKMTEGFAFVAYPAEYRTSGVMTFIVGSDGVVFQRDLGKATDTIAHDMSIFDPDSSWKEAMQSPESREPEVR
jgi:hypothetical protein